VLEVLTASSSRNSILNCAMAEASVRGRKLLAGPGIRAERDVTTDGLVCNVLYVSPKPGLAMVEEERPKD